MQAQRLVAVAPRITGASIAVDDDRRDVELPQPGGKRDAALAAADDQGVRVGGVTQLGDLLLARLAPGLPAPLGSVLGTSGAPLAGRLLVALQLAQGGEQSPAPAVLESHMTDPATDSGLEPDPAVGDAARLAGLTELARHGEPPRRHPAQRAGEKVADAIRALDGDDVPREADQVSPEAVGREQRRCPLDVLGGQRLLERRQPALDLGAGGVWRGGLLGHGQLGHGRLLVRWGLGDILRHWPT